MEEKVKILTFNVRGMNSLQKRRLILREIEQLRADIIFLQETHITQDSRVKIYSKKIPTWYHGDSPCRGSKGVAIGFGKNSGFIIEKIKADPEGQFLFLIGTIQDTKYTLANIYCPNKNPKKFLTEKLTELNDFKQGKLIVAGDFNFIMDHNLDSTSTVPDRERKQLKMVKKKLHELQLVDVWRIQHPSIKDYTYFSTVHRIHTRLDYILLEHRSLEEVFESEIESSVLSDHSPVSTQINFRGESSGRGTWRINEELLEDRDTVKTIKGEIEKYFQENDTLEMARATLWEAHKSVIRGKLISIGARNKKEKRKNMLNLQNEIHKLKQRHKKEVKKEIHRSLILKREQLKDLMEKKR